MTNAPRSCKVRQELREAWLGDRAGGELSFVGVGEKFALGWGSEDGLRVHREQREQRGKDGSGLHGHKP